jgi:hypothetical protein
MAMLVVVRIQNEVGQVHEVFPLLQKPALSVRRFGPSLAVSAAFSFVNVRIGLAGRKHVPTASRLSNNCLGYETIGRHLILMSDANLIVAGDLRASIVHDKIT